jgi:hypothetical protein
MNRLAGYGFIYSMAGFVFRCPNTKTKVQGWTADEMSDDGDTYFPQRCIACRQIHYVNPQTERVLGSDDAAPFGLAGIWENWQEPASGEWLRTFAIITTDANELVADIHDRMPVILAPGDYARWLGEEPDPHDLMRPFPAALMRMWPISTQVNKPENDDPSILEPIELANSIA